MSDEEKPAAAAAILESVELVQFCHSNDVQYAGS